MRVVDDHGGLDEAPEVRISLVRLEPDGKPVTTRPGPSFTSRHNGDTR